MVGERGERRADQLRVVGQEVLLPARVDDRRPLAEERGRVEVGEPETGWVRVANEAMSVEPYMRGRMSGMVTYAQPYELDRPMRAILRAGAYTLSASA